MFVFYIHFSNQLFFLHRLGFNLTTFLGKVIINFIVKTSFQETLLTQVQKQIDHNGKVKHCKHYSDRKPL